MITNKDDHNSTYFFSRGSPGRRSGSPMLRTSLTKEDINRIIDSPYETDYTYSHSRSYNKLIRTDSYTIPQLCRSYPANLEKISWTLYTRRWSYCLIESITTSILNASSNLPGLLLNALIFILTSFQFLSLIIIKLIYIVLTLPFYYSYKVLNACTYSIVNLLQYGISVFSCAITSIYSTTGLVRNVFVGRSSKKSSPTRSKSKTKARTETKFDNTNNNETETGSNLDIPNNKSNVGHLLLLLGLFLPLILLALWYLLPFLNRQNECYKCPTLPRTDEDPILIERINKMVTDTVQRLNLPDSNSNGALKNTDISHSSPHLSSDQEIMEQVHRLIRDELRKYDSDRTGLPDYALETSGAYVLSTRCTVQYDEKSRVQKIFGFPLWYSSYSPRSVIQRKGYGASAGECWAFNGGHGFLTIQLSTRIKVTAVSYEHLPIELSPDGHIKTAPKNFLVWSFQELDDYSTRVLLGNFTYDSQSEPLQMFYIQNIDYNNTPIIELETLSNYGAPVTCLYRFRVHGTPVQKQENQNDDSI